MILGVVVWVSDSVFLGIVVHGILNYEYYYIRPNNVEYLRQVGKSPLLLYLLVAALIFLICMLFSRIQALYEANVNEELLESRKELLRKELEQARLEREEEPKEKKSELFFRTCREIFLSPVFLAVFVVFVFLICKFF